MKHTMGNSPKCYECKFYTEEEDVRTKKTTGYCNCKEYLRTGVNGRVIEKPKDRKPVRWDNCCKHWIDAESGHTRFEVLTGYKEPYDGTKVVFDDVDMRKKVE